MTHEELINSNEYKQVAKEMKKKMDEQIFSIPMSWNKGGSLQLDFYVCDTNEINPNRDIKELGIVIIDREKQSADDFVQIDNSNDFGVEEIESLIKFLHKVKKHIKKFNDNSKPILP